MFKFKTPITVSVEGGSRVRLASNKPVLEWELEIQKTNSEIIGMIAKIPEQTLNVMINDEIIQVTVKNPTVHYMQEQADVLGFRADHLHYVEKRGCTTIEFTI